jgi:DNA-directed RNA polymerase specialized sigma24 family protein
MTEPIVASGAALDELEASRTFEVFYQAEARTLFRRLWLVTGNRAEAEEVMQDAFLRVGAMGPRE